MKLRVFTKSFAYLPNKTRLPLSREKPQLRLCVAAWNNLLLQDRQIKQTNKQNQLEEETYDCRKKRMTNYRKLRIGAGDRVNAGVRLRAKWLAHQRTTDGLWRTEVLLVAFHEAPARVFAFARGPRSINLFKNHQHRREGAGTKCYV